MTFAAITIVVLLLGAYFYCTMKIYSMMLIYGCESHDIKGCTAYLAIMNMLILVMSALVLYGIY